LNSDLDFLEALLCFSVWPSQKAGLLMHDTTMSPAEAVAADKLAESLRVEWFLVILFHPDTRRIGESCCLPTSADPLELGRERPLFGAEGALAHGVGDGYVSRAACRLEPCAEGWRLRLGSGRSRLRVNGGDAQDGLLFTEELLQSGITLSLGPRVALRLRLRTVQPDAPGLAVPELLGISAPMQQLREGIHRAARSRADVLLTGATGTGKECVARAVHELSPRAEGPWVAVNMAALPTEIAAASLFGVRRGAYTGADRSRPGFFQQAAGGTLFLDEVGDTPAPLQPMLLRALQEREVQVVGGSAERVELRVVSATERALESPDTGFRPALRFRLGAQQLELPTLEERREDIGLLAAHFFRRAAAEDDARWLAETANDRELARWARCMEQLSCCSWPGNVRELEHLVTQIHCASEDRLRVPAKLAERLDAVSVEPGVELSSGNVPLAAVHARDEVKDRQPVPFSLAELADTDFLEVWHECRFEVAAAARRLGVSRAAVYRRLKHMDACRLAADVPVAELLAVLEDCRGDLRATAERLAVSRRGLETRLRAGGVVGADPGECGLSTGN
jgi:DNA-binding NtrC family response regulator